MQSMARLSILLALVLAMATSTQAFMMPTGTQIHQEILGTLPPNDDDMCICRAIHERRAKSDEVAVQDNLLTLAKHAFLETAALVL